MDNTAKIKDLTVKADANLTGDVKRGLIKIVREEFANQATVMNDETRAGRDKIIKFHKKAHGIDKLVAKFDKASLEQERVHNELTKLGFDTQGGVRNYGLPKDLEEALNKVNERMRKPLSLRNKIETRLLIASTVGEAVVIVREVMGNDILPNITKDDIKLIT